MGDRDVMQRPYGFIKCRHSVSEDSGSKPIIFFVGKRESSSRRTDGSSHPLMLFPTAKAEQKAPPTSSDGYAT